MTTKPQRDPLHMAIMRAGKKEKTEDIAATIIDLVGAHAAG